MYTDGFVLSIMHDGEFLRERNVGGERQVYLPFKSDYSVYLKNKTDGRAKFQVKIDGKLTHPKDCWYVINPHSTFDLERFMLDGDDGKGEKFRFVNVAGSGEEPGKAENGLVEVTIRKEKIERRSWVAPEPGILYKKHAVRNSSVPDTGINFFHGDANTTTSSSGSCSVSYSNSLSLDNIGDVCDCLSVTEPEGVTVGGDISNQSFVDVPDFKTERGKTVLSVRLKPLKEHRTTSASVCPGCGGKKVQQRNDGVWITCPVCNGTGVFGEVSNV